MSYTQDQIQGCQLSDMIRPIDRVMIELNRQVALLKNSEIPPSSLKAETMRAFNDGTISEAVTAFIFNHFKLHEE